MHVHTQEQRAFIVRMLAAFYSPKDICAAFAALFRDTACDERDVLATDPRVSVVAPELHALFRAERERVLTDPSLAPFAEQQARLIVLSRQAERYEANNQPAEARAVLRQIAEELGVVGGKSAGGAKDKADPSKTPDVKSIEVTRTIVDPVAPADQASAAA